MKLLAHKKNTAPTEQIDQLEIIRADIDRYWFDREEKTFPITSQRLAELLISSPQKKVVYQVTQYKNNKKINALWRAVGGENSANVANNTLHIILSKTMVESLIDDYESGFRAILGRMAKSELGEFYVHFERYDLEFVAGGIGGDGVGAGLKVPKGGA